MRILFIDVTGWDFNVDTPYHKPLGGSQSAACYLAEALAATGQEVTLLTATTQPGLRRGVQCLNFSSPQLGDHSHLDAAVLVQSSAAGPKLRAALPTQIKLVLWTGDTPDAPHHGGLREPQGREPFDGYAFVSEWQRRQYLRFFPIEPERTAVLRNAMGPAFQDLFAPGEKILASKASPPVLAYCSAPFRGLDLLLDVFPTIRQSAPGAQLHVFSSLGMYHVPREQDEAINAQRYARARAMEGVELVGALPQPRLAGRVREALVLAYANTFAETSSIMVMEAMAAGCGVVTSDLGALRETTAGFGRLIPRPRDVDSYRPAFIEAVIEMLQSMKDSGQGAESRLREQVTFANTEYVWKNRAQQWMDWLERLPAKG